jgi:hypothetical protein
VAVYNGYSIAEIIKVSYFFLLCCKVFISLRRRQPLELTAADELLAIENIEVLRKNGFEIEIDEVSVGQGSRLHLTAKPTSGSTDFDIKGRPSPLWYKPVVLTFDDARFGRNHSSNA